MTLLQGLVPGGARLGNDIEIHFSATQVGAWSLAFSQPRTSRYTPAPAKRPATEGLRSK
jgi:hypothetical protein